MDASLLNAIVVQLKDNGRFRTAIVVCPFCFRHHTHGVGGSDDLYLNYGERRAHCRLGFYNIKQVGLHTIKNDSR